MSYAEFERFFDSLSDEHKENVLQFLRLAATDPEAAKRYAEQVSGVRWEDICTG